jgi:hypothetical protein
MSVWRAWLPTDAGALWTIAGFRHDQLVIHADRIECVMHDGHLLLTRRAHLRPSGRLPWAAQ